ncbi:MAG: translation initiation factor IF-2 [Alphaproteobacteria bacterium]|nr:translation initiation factor IF-2 [Rhodospirillales bacterium]MCW9046125.1 translation initiation factor IF-2 [Alphaproteobacteria bacterium]
MTDEKTDGKKTLSLSRPGKLELNKTIEAGQVKQSFSHGRSKSVTVEVKKKRTYTQAEGGRMKEVKDAPIPLVEPKEEAAPPVVKVEKPKAPVVEKPKGNLTNEEKAARVRALQGAKKAQEEAAKNEQIEATKRAEREAEEALKRQAEEEARQKEEAEAAKKAEEEAKTENTVEAAPVKEEKPEPKKSAPAAAPKKTLTVDAKDPAPARAKKPMPQKAGPQKVEEPRRAPAKRGDSRRRGGKMTINQALDNADGRGRTRSLASVKRAREKEKLKQQALLNRDEKFVRDVIIPEVLTVQELANRMAERSGNVIKALMKLGVMATITQSIDGDTAELVVEEFGHKVKRVSEADVEVGLVGEKDREAQRLPRPPVVTVMGHVDHGKTSLLDALRSTDIASGEAGGITQHIGAYQVTLEGGDKISFIDTPGHAAFSAMRARGASVTDLVVLVVAADDGIMPQTIEAIHHAKAANAPIIVAINKMDLPGADPNRVRTELLSHELVVEEMGGDILAVEVSAKKRENLDKLEEAILLQAEILDLKANPNRSAEGVIVEARMERGRGTVATVLVQRGTLKVGDIIVAGQEWGRVRALVDDHGRPADNAGPAVPVEVLGLNGAPAAGDDLVVVTSEARAREVAEFRERKERQARAAAASRGTLEEMFAKAKEGEIQELPVLIKADVQGSIEAIAGALEKMATDEVKVRVLHSGVGGVNESDVTLARASGALIIGFNVRANPQARDMAKRDSIEIRYYSIIYNVVDDLRNALSGMLAPTLQEDFLGYAEIRNVFNITKVGKVAGCMITSGTVKRGSKVRLLRDDVVIHEGDLSTLQRFKDEVKEVKESYECGMSFAKYSDIQVGDVIECFDVKEVARQLEED